MMTRNSQITLESADPLGEEATLLLHAMRGEALSRYKDVVEALGAPPTNEPLGPRCAFLLARLQGQVVGCAALRLMEEEIAEVRRMYVAPAARRQGIARRLLAALEQVALECGYRTLRLETGTRQPEAIALYESHGFHRIPRYGCHVNDPLSICFEKPVAKHKVRAGSSHCS